MGKSKCDRLRGKRTHGYGNTKNARGSGCTGGKGRAGSTKHKFTKYYMTFGTKITQKPKEKLVTVTLERLNEIAKDRKEIDLKEIGVQKILGKGKLLKPITIKNAKYVTPTAKAKIEESGGKIE